MNNELEDVLNKILNSRDEAIRKEVYLTAEIERKDAEIERLKAEIADLKERLSSNRDASDSVACNVVDVQLQKYVEVKQADRALIHDYEANNYIVDMQLCNKYNTTYKDLVDRLEKLGVYLHHSNKK